MIPLATYLLKVILISGILFGYYMLALRNERFHEWNRYYLILSTLISLGLPFARWSALLSGYEPANSLFVARLQTITIGTEMTGNSFHWMQWMGLGYALVVFVLLIGIGSGLLRIYHRFRKGEKQYFHLFTLVRNHKTENPFSFFHFVFWSDKIPLESKVGNHILRHELAHVQEKHSLDKLGMELITALFWINPFFYLMRRELHVIHEFIADRKSCRFEEPHQYASLLVEQAFRNSKVTFANHFFQKRLSRRVHMLIRENKAHFTYFKRIMAVPLTLLIILFFLFLQSQAREKDQSNLTVTKGVVPPPPPPAPQPMADAELYSEKKIFQFVEQMPQFPGGEAALMKFLHDHTHYPQAARENGIEGTVVVQFVVNTDGSISSIKTVGAKKGGGLEEEATRVVENMPAWQPGKQGGRKVAVQYSLPIRFVLQ